MRVKYSEKSISKHLSVAEKSQMATQCDGEFRYIDDFGSGAK
jgi:hypothetical protein